MRKNLFIIEEIKKNCVPGRGAVHAFTLLADEDILSYTKH
jgi:hypothetical protein